MDVRIIGISLGSEQRNYKCSLSLAGRDFVIERIGTNGNIERAKQLIAVHEGKADAIGLGGVNLAYILGERRYALREGIELAKVAKTCPVVDGEFIKQYWEPNLLAQLVARRELKLRGRKVLITSALDRYPLAREIVNQGGRLRVGDGLLALKLPVLFPSLALFEAVAVMTMPMLSRVPLRYLYPLGEKQDKRRKGRDWLIRDVDVIAGDFHLVNRFLPVNLSGKSIMTSTLTAQDRAELLRRGVRRIFSLGVTIGERSLGANMLDAMVAGAARRQVFGTDNKLEVLAILAQELLAQNKS